MGTVGMALLAVVATSGVASARAPARVSPAAAQPPPSADTQRLDAAMARLGRSPRNVETLLDAGMASAGAGDDEASVGFYRRAEQIAPRDPRVLGALASALLRVNDPVGALPLFDRAERAGAMAAATTGDRGLAYDLVGDNARAQRYYRQALTIAENPEITRRLALSQAIAGDPRAGEATLRPLLQAQDKAGWRTRAFIFAISGQVDEAVTVARTLLPGQLADAITPYLRFMPRLTHAQQAAAANLGVFPHASAIGRDDPRIAGYAAGGVGLASADNPLVPTGAPLGRRASATPAAEAPRVRSRAERAAELATRTAPPDPPPARQIPTGSVFGPVDERTASPLVRPVAVPAAPPPATSPPVLAGVRVPQLAAIAARAPAPATPVPLRTATPSPSAGPSLADAFGDIGTPDIPATPRPGAVDVTRLRIERPAAVVPPAAGTPSQTRSTTAKVAKPERAPPSHPSRIWVQLGVGRDPAAMVADWRRMVRAAPAALKGRQPLVSDNGARDRMLTGPFDSEAAARAFVQQLDSAGMAGPYVWISPAGQVVDSLAAR